MKLQAMKETAELARQSAGPISKVVVACLVGDALDLPKFEEAMRAAGYEVTYVDGKNGAWAQAFDSNMELKAKGYSTEGRTDALAHAALGAVREERAAEAVAASLSKASVKVDDGLRRALESRFITHGGQARLDADVADMVRQQAAAGGA